MFKTFGHLSMSQALHLVADLKLAHYMKIPPRDMFLTQLLGTVIGCVVNLLVVRIVLSPASGYRPFLDGTQEDPTGQWDGRKVHLGYSASVIWGVVGPAEFFVGRYKVLYWGFAIGAVLPLIPWLLHKRFGRKCWIPCKKVAVPILLHAAAAPPHIPTNVSRNLRFFAVSCPRARYLHLRVSQIITCGFLVAYLSQKYARERHPRWFERFNNVLSAALDAGASMNALVGFLLAISVIKVFPMPHWAGNPVRDSEHCNWPVEKAL